MTDNGFWFNYSTSFEGLRVVENLITPVVYDAQVEVYSNVEQDSFEFNFSLLKIRYLFEDILNGCLIFNRKNKWAMSRFFRGEKNMSSNSIMLTPEEPAEVLLVSLLKQKLEALSQDSFLVGNIILTGSTSKGLSFSWSGDGTEIDLPTGSEWLDVKEDRTVWWTRNDGSTYDVVNEKNCDHTFSLDFLAGALHNKDTTSDTKVIKRDFKPRVITNDRANR